MRWLLCAVPLCMAALALASCGKTEAPVAPAVRQRDSSSLLTSYGVSKLISDSGRIRYKVVTEEWRIYDRTNPPRHSFPKGILLEKFDNKYHIEMYITADTAYWYNQNLWELRGRVRLWSQDGTVFNSQRLFWDMGRHEFYSNVYSHLKTPTEDVKGMSFRSDERMTRYSISYTSAVFPMPSAAADDKDSVKVAEQNETPEPTSVIAPRTPARATDKPNPNLPPGGHFR